MEISMDRQDRQELLVNRELDLVDMISEVLLHWRGMLLWLIIGAIALGAYSYMDSVKEHNKQERILEGYRQDIADGKKIIDASGMLVDVEKPVIIWNPEAYGDIPEERLQEIFITTRLSAEQTACVKAAVYYQEEFARYNEYVANSALMKINGEKAPRAVAVLRINAEEQEQIPYLQQVYIRLLQYGMVSNELNLIYGLNGYASELINFSGSNGSDYVNGSDSITVSVWGETEELAGAMLDDVIARIQKMTDENQESLGAHSIQVVQKGVSSVYSQEILNAQSTAKYRLMTNEKDCVSKIDEFNITEQMVYYYYLLNGYMDIDSLHELGYYSVGEGAPNGNVALSEEEKTEILTGSISFLVDEDTRISSENIPAIGINKKLTLVGGLAGLVVYAGIWIVIYILSGKLKDTDNMSSLYAIPHIASISSEKKRSRLPGTFIDKWIMQLKWRGRRRMSTEDNLQLVATYVVTKAKENNINTLAIGGNGLTDSCQILNQLIPLIKDKTNLEISVLKDFILDPAAVTKLSQVDGVLLVEQARGSRYDEILDELLMIEGQDKVVLGGVLIN